MRDKIKISVVNFRVKWGDIDDNLARILQITETMGQAGTDMIVFPETALTGYDDDREADRQRKMHVRAAQTVPGPASDAVAKLCQKYGMYAAFGLSEKCKDAVYNSAAVCGPEGVIGAARKIHLPFMEGNWADQGDRPFLFDTPWGPVGAAICYDVYAFPEVTRYCRVMGARLMLNLSAIGTLESGGAGACAGNLPLAYHAQNNSMFIATANLTGRDITTCFMGGASIIGPSDKPPEVRYYAGDSFSEQSVPKESVETATVDLSIADLSFLADVFTKKGWRTENYRQWMEHVEKKEADANMGKEEEK